MIFDPQGNIANSDAFPDYILLKAKITSLIDTNQCGQDEFNRFVKSFNGECQGWAGRAVLHFLEELGCPNCAKYYLFEELINPVTRRQLVLMAVAMIAHYDTGGLDLLECLAAALSFCTETDRPMLNLIGDILAAPTVLSRFQYMRYHTMTDVPRLLRLCRHMHVWADPVMTAYGLASLNLGYLIGGRRARDLTATVDLASVLEWHVFAPLDIAEIEIHLLPTFCGEAVLGLHYTLARRSSMSLPLRKCLAEFAIQLIEHTRDISSVVFFHSGTPFSQWLPFVRSAHLHSWSR